MSAINAKEGEEEDDDIEIINDTDEVEATLNGNSVEASLLQAADDSDWRSILEEAERDHGIIPESCVAKRTRSHTEGVRSRETSLFYAEEEDSGIENPLES